MANYVLETEGGSRVELTPSLEWSGDEPLRRACVAAAAREKILRPLGPADGDKQAALAILVAAALKLNIVLRPPPSVTPRQADVVY